MKIWSHGLPLNSRYAQRGNRRDWPDSYTEYSMQFIKTLTRSLSFHFISMHTGSRRKPQPAFTLVKQRQNTIGWRHPCWPVRIVLTAKMLSVLCSEWQRATQRLSLSSQFVSFPFSLFDWLFEKSTSEQKASLFQLLMNTSQTAPNAKPALHGVKIKQRKVSKHLYHKDHAVHHSILMDPPTCFKKYRVYRRPKPNTNLRVSGCDGSRHLSS